MRGRSISLRYVSSPNCLVINYIAVHILLGTYGSILRVGQASSWYVPNPVLHVHQLSVWLNVEQEAQAALEAIQQARNAKPPPPPQPESSLMMDKTITEGETTTVANTTAVKKVVKKKKPTMTAKEKRERSVCINRADFQWFRLTKHNSSS